jgi:hypothetical protein
MTFLVGRPVTGYDGEGPNTVLGGGEMVEVDVALAADRGLYKPAALRREEI